MNRADEHRAKHTEVSEPHASYLFVSVHAGTFPAFLVVEMERINYQKLVRLKINQLLDQPLMNQGCGRAESPDDRAVPHKIVYGKRFPTLNGTFPTFSGFISCIHLVKSR